MIDGSYGLRNEGTLSSGAPEPRDPGPPTRGQRVELLVPGVK